MTLGVVTSASRSPSAKAEPLVTAYLNDNPLNRFIVYMLYNQVCNKHGDKSNRWNLGLSLSVRPAWPQAPYVRYTAAVEHDIVDSSSPSGEENFF